MTPDPDHTDKDKLLDRDEDWDREARELEEEDYERHWKDRELQAELDRRERM